MLFVQIKNSYQKDITNNLISIVKTMLSGLPSFKHRFHNVVELQEKKDLSSIIFQECTQ